MKIIGIVYSPYYLHIETVREHVEGFSSLRGVDVRYISIDNLRPGDLEKFDAVLIHYAIRFAFPETLPGNFLKILARYKGGKFIFIQDEYDNTENVRKIFSQIMPDIVFTCVPQENIEKIYPAIRFPKTKFVSVLTGFAPDLFSIEQKSSEFREIDIGYRGRVIGSRYGKLGYEKWSIGERVVSHSSQYPHLTLDISSLEDDRIYGGDWYSFLGRCKAVLGTESGSNIFDFDGKLRHISDRKPNLPYEIFERLYLENKELDGLMNQISPRAFEAAATRTLMILYPGEYSGVLVPWQHYLPLERDFSNFKTIVEILSDNRQVDEITERTFNDVIASKKYNKASYFSQIEAHVTKVLDQANFIPSLLNDLPSYPSGVVGKLIAAQAIENLHFPGRSIVRSLWRLIPTRLRLRILRLLNFMLSRSRKN